jgi:hypothetical protein
VSRRGNSDLYDGRNECNNNNNGYKNNANCNKIRLILKEQKLREKTLKISSKFVSPSAKDYLKDKSLNSMACL